MSEIKAVIFDFDMTLADTSRGIHYCMNEVAKVFGLKEVSHSAVLKTIGIKMPEAMRMLWGDFKPEWTDYYRENLRPAEAARNELFPCTVPALESLRANGFKIALATNRAYPYRPIKENKIEQYFDFAVGMSDVENPKPAPDMLLLALDKFKLSADEAVYVGDTAVDMKTASYAGVKGIGMITGTYGAAELLAAGAYKTLDNLSELLHAIK